jgi:hypothetical protein
MTAILKRHCYHSNGNDVIFVNNFQLLEACSIYVVQFLSSNKKPLPKKLNLNHDFVIFQKLYWATLNEGDLAFTCILVIKSYGLLQQKMMEKYQSLISLAKMCQFFYIGHLTRLNRSVTCPVIKSLDRTKGKIWPDNVRWPALICRSLSVIDLSSFQL